MTRDDDDDGAFLSELLTLIDGTDDDAWAAELTGVPAVPAVSAVVKAAEAAEATIPPENVAPSATTSRRRTTATGGAAGLKRTLDATRLEALQLMDDLARLRAVHGNDASPAMELALRERRKRLRAQDECRELREAVYTQTQFLRGLRSVFSATPRFSLSLDMCRYMHHHVRLPRQQRARWGEFAEESQDERLRAAMDVLCHETESMALTDQPYDVAQVHGERVDDVNSRSTTAMAVYSVDTTDIAAVVRAVCVAIRDVVTICPSGHPLRVSRDIVDVEASASGNVLYRVMSVSHCCPETGEELSMESHVVTSYKIFADYAVVMWDFVDADDLHPTPDSTNVTREITGACLIRREWCDDGVERTVFRSLSTKKFRFCSGVSPEKLRKFVCIAHPVSLVRGNELLFRRIVMEQLAAEKAVAASSHTMAVR